jgi:peptide/nickel transport system permease protein
MSAIADVEIEAAGALHADRQVARRELISELLHSPAFLVGAFILLVWIICAIFGTAIAPHSPYAQTLLGINKAPSSAHPFGTDQLGRDMLSRVIVGSRDILVIAPLATLLGTVLGTAVGLVMGYYRGIVDDVLGRVVEAFLARPTRR